MVYTLATSSDCEYVVVGGTSKALVTLDGQTGRQLHSKMMTGDIWCVRMMADGSRTVCCGDFHTINIYNTVTGNEVIRLRMVETVQYGVSISNCSVCFTSQDQVYLYGRGGTRYGWQDQPSFAVVAKLTKSLLSEEQELYECMKLIVSNFPTVVHSQDTNNGKDFLHFFVENSNNIDVLRLILQVDLQIGFLSVNDLD